MYNLIILNVFKEKVAKKVYPLKHHKNYNKLYILVCQRQKRAVL